MAHIVSQAAGRIGRRPGVALALVLATLLCALPQHGAFAQSGKAPPPDLREAIPDDAELDVGESGDDIPLEEGSISEEALLPDEAAGRRGAPVDLSQPIEAIPPGPPQDVLLEARLTGDLPPLAGGLVWRVFGHEAGADGRLPLIAEVKGGSARLQLLPGIYLLHAGYGRAAAIKRIAVRFMPVNESLVLNAGGLRLSSFAGKDRKLLANLSSFEIYALDDEVAGERTLVAPNIAPDRIVRLNAGRYHVIAHYGDANAVVRADVTVEPGKVTDAAFYHQAARITLKLVSERGGEALANTAWTVQTPGGDTLFDSVGAFPSVVLAAGQYTAIAKHDGRIIEASFTVEPDLNRDIEVLAKK